MTYSIVARDPATGRFGVAIQTRWPFVGAGCPWVESGVGAVATQSFTEIAHGPNGLALLRAGRTAPRRARARCSTTIRAGPSARSGSSTRPGAAASCTGESLRGGGRARHCRRRRGPGEHDGAADGLAGDARPRAAHRRCRSSIGCWRRSGRRSRGRRHPRSAVGGA